MKQKGGIFIFTILKYTNRNSTLGAVA